MKVSVSFKNIVVDVISVLFILLFVYAGISKLLDFQNFRAQIGLSPLLSSFADYVSVGIIILEIFIALLLSFKKFRLIGLYSSFSLMVMFSTYIFLILNYSSFIPCSCGGILEKMGWKQHFIFNLAFVFLAGSGIMILRKHSYSRKSIFTLFVIAIASIGIVALLYLMSEDMIKHKNSFIRRFPHSAAERETTTIDLKHNGYYFAGVSSDKIYLANYTAPLQILAIDSGLKQIKQIKLSISDYSLPFRSVQIKIIPPYFYVMDGSVPVIFNGKISDWTAYPVKGNYGHFLRAEPMDSVNIILRAQLLESGENILGTFAIGDTTKSHYSTKVLEKQIDGFFDTDGTFYYSQQLKKIVYLYRYRNQFIVADEKLKVDYRGKTIDTTEKAHLKIVNIKNSGDRKLAAPPYVVNSTAALSGKLLFVKSNLRGRYESASMWKEASVVDVYNIETNSYLASFYVYNQDKDKMNSFVVSGNNLYAIIGSHIHKYVLGKAISDENKQSK